MLQGSDPLISTARGKLQSRRSKLNDQINRELRMRNGAENLFRYFKSAVSYYGIIKYHFSCMNHLSSINDYEINVSYKKKQYFYKIKVL